MDTRVKKGSRANASYYKKESVVNGRSVQIKCLNVNGNSLMLEGSFPRIARLEDEWFEDLLDPEQTVRQLAELKSNRPDILTFWQRLPDVDARYPYVQIEEELAVLQITTYDEWWSTKIKSRVRTQIRKCAKAGVDIRESEFDDAFVRGMTAIFNESPVRQGKAFWHYGKNTETVKRQFSRYLFRERMIGAYLGDEMIGFIMLANAGRFALPGQIISSLKHRDKSLNNALIAKAIEICAAQGNDYLVYYYWGEDSLAEFKRRCGFEPVTIPRYFVPVTMLGQIALSAGLHRGWRSMIPSTVREKLKAARRRWYELRTENRI